MKDRIQIVLTGDAARRLAIEAEKTRRKFTAIVILALEMWYAKGKK